MALGTPVAAAAAYSAQGGTTVAPAYPAGILATDAVLLFVGQKPSTDNGGTVTTPAGWTLREELLAAGGYGTTLGADTGNTNLSVYSWDTPVAGQTGTRSVTLGTNNVSWAFMVRIPTGGGAISFGSADGQRTTTPPSPMSIALTNGATATDFQTGDRAIWAMCIPTDVQTPTQFSAQSITATGATFGAATELNEPDSTTGNDIGGYSAWAAVTAGSSTTAPTVTVTLAGTLTNVRGPVVLLRVREAAVTHATTGTLTGQGSTVTGAADRQSAAVTHATTGALTGQGSAVAGAAARTRAHDTSGTLPGQTATVAGSAARAAGAVTHATTGALTGPGSTVAGTSARFRAFAASGALAGQGSTATGSSARFRAFATSGTLTGQGATLAGAAARTRAHPTTGTLTGQGSTIAGSAARVGAPVTHATTGALTGSGSTVAGASARTRAHPTTGTLTGQGSTLAGSAARTLLHATTGVLAGANAIIVGNAARTGAAVTHDTSGSLVGPGAIIVGEADPALPDLLGESWMPQIKRRRRWSEERDEREQLRKDILSAIEPVAEKEAKVVNVKGKVAVVTKSQAIPIPVPPQFDAQAVVRMVMSVLEKQGIEAQRVREIEARKQARIAFERERQRRLIKRRREEEIMLLMG